MTTYNDLLKQIESLTKQAEELRKTEISTVIADIKDKMETFGITLADLGAARATKKTGGSGSKVAVKYRNGSDIWSGRGRTPKWLADAEASGANRESFLVK
ncbi:H-NS family nucleoid-associated regulatory protein [Hydrocarboniphaga effusa]|uniref:H-NS histone family protein n=1 Tax=Hydrocarboniphaga effusa TaxID=243629 RepID=UPI003BAB5260